MRLLGMRDDLQQANEVEVKQTADYSCSLARSALAEPLVMVQTVGIRH